MEEFKQTFFTLVEREIARHQPLANWRIQMALNVLYREIREQAGQFTVAQR